MRCALPCFKVGSRGTRKELSVMHGPAHANSPDACPPFSARVSRVGSIPLSLSHRSRTEFGKRRIVHQPGRSSELAGLPEPRNR